MRFLVVTVNEGGADFDEYGSKNELLDKWDWHTNPWWSEANIEATKEEIRNAVLGDEITMDGCSTCFVLRKV